MNVELARIWGAFAVVFGLAGAAVPRRFLGVAERILLAGYENPDALEPSEWYVSAIRAKFGLTALTGAVVVALEYGEWGRENAGADADANDSE